LKQVGLAVWRWYDTSVELSPALPCFACNLQPEWLWRAKWGKFSSFFQNDPGVDVEWVAGVGGLDGGSDGGNFGYQQI